MKKLKKALSLSLALVLSLAMAVPAFAASPEFKHFTFSTEPLGTATYDYFSQNSFGDKTWVCQFTVVVLPDNSSYTVKLENCGLFYWDKRDVDGMGYGYAHDSDFIFDVSNTGAHIYESGTFKVDESHYTFWGISAADGTALEEIIVMSKTCAMALPDEGIKAAALQALNGNSQQPTTPTDPEQPSQPEQPAKKLAKAADQNITIDGKAVAFQTYVLHGTNYVKLRDIAHVLNGTGASFSVDYDNQKKSISLSSGKAYQDTGAEMSTPFAGANKEYNRKNLTIIVNGSPVELDALSMKDDSGNGYTYFKLRDLGSALGFNVSWTAEKGVYIESDKPYVG